MTYFVTGATGFLGRFLIGNLLKRKGTIHVLVRRASKEKFEALQARYQSAPTYQVVGESGPPHDRTFEVTVLFHGVVLGRGSGKSKKGAEQRAAFQALETLPPNESGE